MSDLNSMDESYVHEPFQADGETGFDEGFFLLRSRRCKHGVERLCERRNDVRIRARLGLERILDRRLFNLLQHRGRRRGRRRRGHKGRGRRCGDWRGVRRSRLCDRIVTRERASMRRSLAATSHIS